MNLLYNCTIAHLGPTLTATNIIYGPNYIMADLYDSLIRFGLESELSHHIQ